MSAEAAAEATGAEGVSVALAEEPVAEAMAAEKVWVKEELLNQLSQFGHLSSYVLDSIA